MIQSRPVKRAPPYSPRRRALQRRTAPLGAAALLAFVVGVAVGAGHRPAEQDAAEQYTRAWARSDWSGMYALLSERARDRVSLDAFRTAHEEAARTATVTRVRAGETRGSDGEVVAVPLRIDTRVFGTVRLDVRLPFDDEGDPRGVDWTEALVFPGMRAGERLARATRLPTRATLHAADGTVIARGDERRTEDAEVQRSIGGALGAVPEARAAELRALGVPDDARVGVTGLERALDDELRGRPGGELRAGPRVLARAEPRPADPVRSTIVPRVQRAAVAALAGRVGGAVAMNPRTGAVQAAAGIGLSGLQPPGSTFKIITLAGALEARITSTRRSYPVETATTLEGVRLENANAESCGGTLIQSFAHSCNTVFAPLGAQLGARRLVRAAELFGFNRPPGIDGAATSTLPPAGEIGDDLAVGSTAIGQGRLQATALQMTVVAATVANRGRRPIPTLLAGAPPRFTDTFPADTMRAVARGMRAVVEDGTGTAAAIEGTGVAGKTGTAELQSTVGPAPGSSPTAPLETVETTAWFTAYAPTRNARAAAAVMLVEAGAGGAVAAPATKPLLEAALRRAR